MTEGTSLTEQMMVGLANAYTVLGVGRWWSIIFVVMIFRAYTAVQIKSE